MSAKPDTPKPRTWTDHIREQEEKHRQLRKSLVRLPTFYGMNSMKKYSMTGWEWEGMMEFKEGKRKAFRFEYEAVFPEGRVFPNRKAHYKIVVNREDGGLFSADTLQAWIGVLAYPSSEYNQDGYGYEMFFYLEKPGTTRDNILTVCDAIISDLQDFINKPELGDKHSQGDRGYSYSYKFYDYLSLDRVDRFRL